jgi:hypothetical protein
MKDFSPRFYRAIDAMQHITSETAVDNFFVAAADYEHQLRDHAKFNPLRIGSFVAAYDNADHSRFIAYGQITGMEWHEAITAYKYELQVCQSTAVIHAWSFHIREVDASEIRQLFTRVRG